MLPELSLWKCQRWNQPIQWCTNSSECFPSRRRLPNVTGAIVIALKTRKPQTAPQALMGMSQDIRPYIIPCYTSNSFSSNLFTHKKQMTQIKASEDPEKGGRKKKKNKDEKKNIRLSTEETGKWLTSWAYVLIQTHCPCCTITIHLTDILVGWFVLEYQDRLGDAELQQAITQGYHNTK